MMNDICSLIKGVSKVLKVLKQFIVPLEKFLDYNEMKTEVGI